MPRREVALIIPLIKIEFFFGDHQWIIERGFHLRYKKVNLFFALHGKRLQDVLFKSDIPPVIGHQDRRSSGIRIDPIHKPVQGNTVKREDVLEPFLQMIEFFVQNRRIRLPENVVQVQAGQFFIQIRNGYGVAGTGGKRRKGRRGKTINRISVSAVHFCLNQVNPPYHMGNMPSDAFVWVAAETGPFAQRFDY